MRAGTVTRTQIALIVAILLVAGVIVERLVTAGSIVNICQNQEVSIGVHAHGADTADQAFQAWRSQAGSWFGVPSHGWRTITTPDLVTRTRKSWMVQLSYVRNQGWFFSSSTC